MRYLIIAGVIFGVVAAAIVIGVIVMLLRRIYRRQAQRGGYASIGDYLRAAPRSDEEKRDAVDLTLWGLVICVLGLIFPPFLIIGLFPFFHGARKIGYASMGLGLVDDGDQPGE